MLFSVERFLPQFLGTVGKLSLALLDPDNIRSDTDLDIKQLSVGVSVSIVEGEEFEICIQYSNQVGSTFEESTELSALRTQFGMQVALII